MAKTGEEICGTHATPSVSGTPGGGSACTQSISTPDGLVIDVAKVMRMSALANQLSLVGGHRSTTTTPRTTASFEASNGERQLARDDSFDEALDEHSPGAEVTESRQADGLPVQQAATEASEAPPVWPEELEIFDLGVVMLTGGTGFPTEPPRHYEPTNN